MRIIPIFLALALCACTQAGESSHPSLLLTSRGVKEIRAHKGKLPVFDASLDKLIQDADAAVAREICLPTPKDGGGGYSHEMHKLNYYDMYNAKSWFVYPAELVEEMSGGQITAVTFYASYNGGVSGGEMPISEEDLYKVISVAAPVLITIPEDGGEPDTELLTDVIGYTRELTYSHTFDTAIARLKVLAPTPEK